MQSQLALSVLSGMTVTNPEVRRQYRALLLRHTDFSSVSALTQLVADTRPYADKRQ